jgi:hypothetical protein
VDVNDAAMRGHPMQMAQWRLVEDAPEVPARDGHGNVHVYGAALLTSRNAPAYQPLVGQGKRCTMAAGPADRLFTPAAAGGPQLAATTGNL